jgi:hypothetical protein
MSEELGCKMVVLARFLQEGVEKDLINAYLQMLTGPASCTAFEVSKELSALLQQLNEPVSQQEE